jgi:hypothetical protein
MLFDLQGKRRRLVQATYLTLAILMGGGLVLFGIGSDAQGGLLDGCSSDDGTGDANPALEERLDDAESRLATNPEDEVALTELVRANYQLAADRTDPETGVFGEESVEHLQAASDAWQRYLDLDPKQPDDSLAGLMVQAYGDLGLNQPEQAAEAAGIVAEERPSTNAFLELARYAALAGQTRKAELAGARAVELASKEERKQVQKLVDQLTAPQAPAAGGPAPGAGGQSGAPPPPGPPTGGESPGGGQP